MKTAPSLLLLLLSLIALCQSTRAASATTANVFGPWTAQIQQLQSQIAAASASATAANAATSNAFAAQLLALSNRVMNARQDALFPWNLYADFEGPDGAITTNAFRSENVAIGTPLHIRGPGGADLGTAVTRSRGGIIFSGTNSGVQESMYMALSANVTNSLRHVAARFDIAEGTTINQTPLLMISSSGVVEAGRLVHFGYAPQFGTANVTFHTNGFNGLSNWISFDFLDLPLFGPQSNNVFSYTIDGTNLWANFNGVIRYTNSPRLDDWPWGTNIICQSFEPTGNTDRNVRWRAVAGTSVPVPLGSGTNGF